jgi:hypothetical protein
MTCGVVIDSDEDEGLGAVMAQKIQVLLIDDVDGSEAEETISFALDGNAYEIDLTSANAARLRDAIAPWIGHARRASNGRALPGGRSGRSSARVDREQTQAIRDWARSNGHQVSDRGRIPAAIVEAYHSAQ